MLFWALRGSGAGNFGVVTSMTVEACPGLTITAMRYNITTGGNLAKTSFGPCLGRLWRADSARHLRVRQLLGRLVRRLSAGGL